MIKADKTRKSPEGNVIMTDKPDYNRVLSLGEIAKILRANGRTELKQIIKNYGALTARLAMLRIAVEDKLAQPYLKNYPPAIFLAYKWEGEEHQAWVRSLAAHFKAKGYNILLDQDHLERDASNFEEVPQYIAGMIGCDLFLIIVTEKYLDLVEERHQQTSWVTDEYETALKLHNQGRLRIAAIWKDTGVRPEKLNLRLEV